MQLEIKLFTPGPTQVPERVRLRLAQPLIYHRSPEFRQILQRVEKNLQYIFQTEQNVYVLTSSGTAAMEAVIANLLSSDDQALVIEAGKFGARWSELCMAYGVPVTSHKLPWGRALQPDELVGLLQAKNDFRAVFLTHCETSTGVAIDLPVLAKVIHQYSAALVIVDGISSVGALPLKMREWGLDAVVSAAQKGFMCPPGLSFVACSPRAEQAMIATNRPRYYFDLRKARQALEHNDTPFTPAISLLLGLDEALQMMCTEGLERIWQRHHRLAQATRATMIGLNLQLFAEQPADVVTVVRLPAALQDKDLIGQLKNRGFIIAGGQGKLKGQIFRIAHLGACDEQDLAELIAALATVLRESGWACQPDAVVSTFRQQLTAGR